MRLLQRSMVDTWGLPVAIIVGVWVGGIEGLVVGAFAWLLGALGAIATFVESPQEPV